MKCVTKEELQHANAVLDAARKQTEQFIVDAFTKNASVWPSEDQEIRINENSFHVYRDIENFPDRIKIKYLDRDWIQLQTPITGVVYMRVQNGAVFTLCEELEWAGHVIALPKNTSITFHYLGVHPMDKQLVPRNPGPDLTLPDVNLI